MTQLPLESETDRLEGIKVASRPSSPMPISERAKQFLPFAAVKGLPEALAKKEISRVFKKEITEEMALELDEKIHRIEKGATVTVTYFDADAYVKRIGTVVQIDSIFRTLQIDDVIISIDDIYDMVEN